MAQLERTPPKKKRYTNAKALKKDAQDRREKVAEERLIIRHVVDDYINAIPDITTCDDVNINTRAIINAIPNARFMHSNLWKIRAVIRERLEELRCLHHERKWYFTVFSWRPLE